MQKKELCYIIRSYNFNNRKSKTESIFRCNERRKDSISAYFQAKQKYEELQKLYPYKVFSIRSRYLPYLSFCENQLKLDLKYN